MAPSSDALLTRTSSPPSARAAPTSRARTAASVMSPATATTGEPSLAIEPRHCLQGVRSPRPPTTSVAAPGEHPGDHPPSPRLAPVTIATRFDFSHALTSPLTFQRRTSSALEVKRKCWQTGW